jgi:hypothetical protein
MSSLFRQGGDRLALSGKVLWGDADGTDRFFESDGREHDADSGTENSLVGAPPFEGVTGLFDDSAELVGGDLGRFHALRVSLIRHIASFHILYSIAA